MEVIWSKQAKQDLKDILLFWKDYTNSNSYAQKIQLSIEQELYYLIKCPEIYPDTDFKNIKRAIILGNFSLFFSVNAEYIRIIRFWDNRRNPNKLDVGS